MKNEIFVLFKLSFIFCKKNGKESFSAFSDEEKNYF